SPCLRGEIIRRYFGSSNRAVPRSGRMGRSAARRAVTQKAQPQLRGNAAGWGEVADDVIVRLNPSEGALAVLVAAFGQDEAVLTDVLQAKHDDGRWMSLEGGEHSVLAGGQQFRRHQVGDR